MEKIKSIPRYLTENLTENLPFFRASLLKVVAVTSPDKEDAPTCKKYLKAQPSSCQRQ